MARTKTALGNTIDHEHNHHVMPVSFYLKTLIFLAFFMVVTIIMAFQPLPDVLGIPGIIINNVIAVGIATIKAVAVILNFMNVKNSTNLIKIWVIAGFVGFSLMFIVFGDYAARPMESVLGWEKGKEGSLPRKVSDEVSQPASKNEINVRPR